MVARNHPENCGHDACNLIRELLKFSKTVTIVEFELSLDDEQQTKPIRVLAHCRLCKFPFGGPATFGFHETYRDAHGGLCPPAEQIRNRPGLQQTYVMCVMGDARAQAECLDVLDLTVVVDGYTEFRKLRT